MEAARIRGRFLPALELLPNLGLIAVLGYGGHQVLNGQPERSATWWRSTPTWCC